VEEPRLHEIFVRHAGSRGGSGTETSAGADRHAGTGLNQGATP
jgi:hypothetical protein